MRLTADVAVLCEYSGTVRDAFAAAGYSAVSCDLLPSETKGRHWQGDVFRFLENRRFHLIVAHPPCTALAVCGNATYADTPARDRALVWTARLWNAMRNRARLVCMENPVGVLSTRWQPATQYIQPWQFGHPESKKTGLWLWGLPPLKPTHHKPRRIETRVWYMSPGPDRGKERSRFYPGIAKAMQLQWSPYI